MSHAWDGFRMEVATLDEAMDVVDAFRPVATTMSERWNAEVLADTVADVVDRHWIRTGRVPKGSLATASQMVDDRRRKISREGIRDPRVDPEFNLTLMRHEGSVYGLVHTEQTPWRTAWLSVSGVVDYSWWNGSDRPVGISQARWNARGKAWRAMIPGLRPADRGMLIVLTPGYRTPTPQEVLSAIPDMDRRRETMARDIVFSDRYRHVMSTDEPCDDMAIVHDLVTWAESDEGMAEHRRISDGLKLPEIDMATIMKQARLHGRTRNQNDEEHRATRHIAP